MNKYLLLFCALAWAGTSWSQQSTVSPYSFFGFGQQQRVSTAENEAMGGITLYGDSIHGALNNPASLGKLKLTVYSLGLSRTQSDLASDLGSQSGSSTRLSYLGIAFPITPKASFGFGVVPYAAMDYNLFSESEDSEGVTSKNLFQGTGDWSRMYFSGGWNLNKYLSVGASMNAHFGYVEKQRIQSLDALILGTFERKFSRIRGIGWTLAANAELPLSSSLTLFGTAQLQTEASLTSENTLELGSIVMSSNQKVEVEEVDLSGSGMVETDLVLPTVTRLGIGLGNDMSWLLSAEYEMQDMGALQSEFLTQSQVQYTQASTWRIGGYWVPSFDTFAKYRQRVTYRFGGYLTETGMIVQNQPIEESGITFGVGLPLSGTFSNLNLNVGAGKRGTTQGGLIEEQFVKFSLGLSLNDRWFVKRKIN